MEWLREKLLIDHTITADEDVVLDLPENPVSFLAIDIEAELTDTQGVMQYGDFSKHVRHVHVRVDHRDIVLTDAPEQQAIYTGLTGHVPMYHRDRAIQTEFGKMQIIIPFGRTLFSTDEMLPALQKGRATVEVQLRHTRNNSNNPRYNIYAITIPEAKPTKCLSYYMRGNYLVAGNEYKHEIPRDGHLIAHFLCDYYLPSGMDGPFIWEDVALLLNDSMHYYNYIPWHGLTNQWGWRRSAYYGQAAWDANAFQNYPLFFEFAFLDYDTDKKLTFAPDLRKYQKAELFHRCGVSEWMAMYHIRLIDFNEIYGG